MTTNISLTSGMKLAMMETDTLFEHHTVKEIQDIEKKIRNDIERKKEDLRQMVGERYRDLMEAADKITEMKVNSEKVNKHILAMETICKRLEHWNIQPKLHTSESPRKLETEILYGLVAQVNLLVQAPIKMWEMLENNEYLNAVQVFLLARHTHTSLVLMPSNKVSAATVVKLFPVISRQWAVIKPFQTSILQVCQKALISQDISEEDVSKALACIVLLSDSTPEAVFREYMEARKVAVQQMFKPERQGTTTKVLVCELVLLVVKTLHAVHRVCYASEETTKTFEGGTGSTVNDLLIKTLIEVTKKDCVGPVSLLKLDGAPISKFLPSTITDFRPAFKNDYCSVHPEVLQEVCQQWTDQLSRDIEKGLWELLECIRTIKGVAHVRDAVFELLCQNDYTTRWEQACQDVLGKSMSLWETFLRPVFIHRIKDLLSSQLKSCSTNCKSKICRVLEDLKEAKGRTLAMERDVTMYVWTEMPADCTTKLAWTPYTNRTLWESGSLAMKAKGLTPKVQYLCSDLDNGLSKLLEDLATFVRDDQKDECLGEDSFTSSSEWKYMKLVDINTDKKEIDNYLTNETKLCLQSIMQYIEEMVSVVEISDSETDVWPVFLGRLTTGMAELCPHLQQCFVGSDNDESHQFLRVTQNTTDTKKVEETDWERVKSKLLTQSASLFGIWARNFVKKLCGELETQLYGVSPVTILSSILEWEEIEIQEETEGGQTVKSTIQIPLQVSVPLQSTVFQLCQAINRAAGHSLNRLEEITSIFLEHVLEIYGAAAKEIFNRLTEGSHLRQTWAHQLLFDVRYLAALFRVKERSNPQQTAKLEQIIRDLENLIDPFDLDVFNPHFKMNLSRALQRSSLLLGLAISGDLVGSWDNARSKPQTGQSDHHNVLPLMSGSVKFPLLPVSTQTSKQLLQPPQHLRSSTASQSSSSSSKSASFHDSRNQSSPNLANSSSSSITKSASLYDRMTAMSSSLLAGLESWQN